MDTELSAALHTLAECCAATTDPHRQAMLLDAIHSLLDALDDMDASL